MNKIILLGFLLFAPNPNKHTDLRTNFDTKTFPMTCDEIKDNYTPTGFFTDSAEVCNYPLMLKYLYCKQRKDSLSENDVQDLSIVGAFPEIMRIDSLNYFASQSKALMHYPIKEDELMDFDSFIIRIADKEKVVMLNDAHARMETRAFFLSKLKMFKELGFTHLAMEAFQNVAEPYPSFKPGYYFQEPLMAEIYRQAKRLGFHLVQYEGLGSERMEEQAANLYSQLSQLKPNEKILVFSGYSNMAEDVPEGVRSMGSILKQKYHIDPLTIDLTRGLKFTGSTDILFEKTGSFIHGGLVSSDSVKKRVGFGLMDYFYISPDYVSTVGRPQWLSAGGVRKSVAYRLKPTKAVLVQVYYQDEIKNDPELKNLTPADMVFQSEEDGRVHFS